MSTYAHVIPLTRLKRDLHYFDYAIPKALEGNLKKGYLVDIPFRNKTIQGVVLRITKKTDVPTSRIKAIKGIAYDKGQIVTSWQLALIEWMSSYYFTSMSVIARMMIPEIPKRSRAVPKTQTLPPQKCEIEHTITLPNTDTPILIKYSKDDSRISAYRHIIEKNKGEGKQTLIICPLLFDVFEVQQYLSDYERETSLYLTSLNKSAQWKEWQAIQNNKSTVIIGTRSALFAPIQHIGSIIIDQSHDENHKQEEPNPRYNAKAVAEKIHEYTSCSLFFSSISPTIETLYHVHKKEYGYTDLDSRADLPAVSIINKNDEFKKGNYHPLSEYLQERLKRNAMVGKTVFLFLNRRGEATIIACRDCGKSIACPQCNLPLTQHETTTLQCHHCDYKQDMVLFCPSCESPNIKAAGIGIDKLEKVIQELIPTASIITIDGDTPDPERAIPSSYEQVDIIIGTSFSFRFIDWKKIYLIGVVSADTLLHIPDYRSFEKTFNQLYALTHSIPNNDKEIIIQTASPNNYVIESLQKLSYKEFYTNEIQERKQFSYPPYGRLVKLTYASPSYGAGIQEAQKLVIALRNEKKKAEIMITDARLAHQAKIRNKFRFNVIIKMPTDIHQLGFLSIVPENWIIDVDPENLL